MTSLLTYEQQKKLVELGLAKEKVNNHFSTFKYTRKVHFDNLWDSVEGITVKECRGHTYDNKTGLIITASPRKSFNYLENGHWSTIPDTEKVVAFKKYNGFLGCASNYHGSIIVSTTGSTDSSYAELAKKHILESSIHPEDGFTYWYEILDESDPHIVDEKITGAVFLGRRNHLTGHQDPYGEIHYMTFGEVKEMVNEDKGEGFMVYQLNDDFSCLNPCKMKTPYYNFKKYMMRLNDAKVTHTWEHGSKMINSKYNSCVRTIKNEFSAEQWIITNEMNRRKVIEEIIG